MKKFFVCIMFCCFLLQAENLEKYLPVDSIGLWAFSAEKVRECYPEFRSGKLPGFSGIPTAVPIREGLFSVSEDGSFTGVVSGGPDPLNIAEPQGIVKFQKRIVNGKNVYRFMGKKGNIELVDFGKGIILITENYEEFSRKKTGIPANLAEMIQLKNTCSKMIIRPPKNFFSQNGQGGAFKVPPFSELYLEAYQNAEKALCFSGYATAYDDQGAAQLMLLLQQFQLFAGIALNNENPALAAQFNQAFLLRQKQNRLDIQAVFPEKMIAELRKQLERTANKSKQQQNVK